MTTEFFIEVQDGNPIQLIRRHAPPPQDIAAGLSYWALSMNEALAHIYYRGEFPPDKIRDRINAAVADYAGKLLQEH
jgi:hypothetical protein